MGALLMTVGNGVISGMDKGLQKNIVTGFSGDIVLVSDKQESDNVFIEFMGKAIEPINNFKQIDTVFQDMISLTNTSRSEKIPRWCSARLLMVWDLPT